MYRRQTTLELQARQRATLANKSKQHMAKSLVNINQLEETTTVPGRLTQATHSLLKMVRYMVSFFSWGVREEGRLHSALSRALIKREHQHRDPHRRRIRKLVRAARRVSRNPSNPKARAKLARMSHAA